MFNRYLFRGEWHDPKTELVARRGPFAVYRVESFTLLGAPRVAFELYDWAGAGLARYDYTEEGAALREMRARADRLLEAFRQYP